tara:strand:+ start:223 stop:642 length:420 start_codon:yes stop_codon:yes gene_type:complete
MPKIYKDSEKKEILDNYYFFITEEKGLDDEFINSQKISRATFYNWLKEFDGKNNFLEKYKDKVNNTQITPKTIKSNFLMNGKDRSIIILIGVIIYLLVLLYNEKLGIKSLFLESISALLFVFFLLILIFWNHIKFQIKK